MDETTDDDETSEYELAPARKKIVFLTFWFLVTTIMWIAVFDTIIQWGNHMDVFDGWVVVWMVGWFILAFYGGLIIAFFHSKYAINLPLVGVMIIEILLIWGFVTAPDNTSREYLLLAMVIPVLGYLVLRLVYDRVWREYEMPFDKYSELDRAPKM